jgi:hypothetical protein
MTDRPDDPAPAANENIDPFLRFDTGLAELYRLRREVLKVAVAGLSLEQYRLRQAALEKFARAEAMALAKL